MDKIGKRFTLILILLVMLTIVFSNPVLPVKGQYYYASIHVTSPIQNQIYSTNTIPLNFTMDTNIVNQSVYSVASFLCNLDGNRDYTGGTAIPMSGMPDDFFQPVPNTYNTTINVPNGNHLLWVQIDFMVNDTSKFPKYVPTVVENLSQIVSFTVDTTNTQQPSTSPSPTVTVDQPWWRTIGINQQTEFTTHVVGGMPPYTFQWYVTYLDPSLQPENWSTVAVPNSNTSTFKFSESTLGKYGISLQINDSNGESEYQSFQPMGIVVTVQSLSVASPSLTPTNAPSSTVPELSWLIILPLLFLCSQLP